MKVLIVSFYYEPEFGAAPSRITNLAKGLKAMGVDVDVLTCLPNYPKGRVFDGYRRRFSMKETIEYLRANGITCPIIVGGAVMTPDIASAIGATYYSKDALETAHLMQEICGAK